MTICSYARIIDKDTIICSKYDSYCYLDTPDSKLCTELYGKDDNEINEYLEDVSLGEDNSDIDDIILYDEEGDDINNE